MGNYTAHNSLLPFMLAHQIFSAHKVNKYNLCFSYQLPDPDFIPVIINALQKMVSAQAYLRQTFAIEHDQIKGKIHDYLPANIKYHLINFDELPSLEDRLIKENHNIEFDSLINLNIIRFVTEKRIILLFNIHHILMDGTSFEFFISDLNRLIRGEKLLEQTAQSYIEQLSQEQDLAKGPNNGTSQNYIALINKISKDINFFDGSSAIKAHHYSAKMRQELKKRLIQISKKYRLSQFNVLLLAWSVFDAKINNQNSNLVSFPVNIRRNKALSGCFINTTIFPLETIEDKSFKDLMDSLKKDLTFFKDCSRLTFNHYFNLDPASSFAYSPFAKPGDLIIDNNIFECKSYAQIANASINVKYCEYQDSLYFSADILLEFMPDFVASTLLIRFFNFIDNVFDNIKKPLSQIDIVFPKEKKQILYDFNNTKRFYPKNETLIDLFEEQVNRTPEQIACVYEDIRLTYKELNEKSNQLAHYLINCHQVKPDDFIALLLDRSECIIISILAVLKAGGAYVPLDLSYPRERLNYILEDTQANMLIINENHLDNFPIKENNSLYYKNCKLIIIDNRSTELELNKCSKNNIITADTSANLAYVIYTSGTTGQPKGVMIEHKNIINTLRDLFYIYQKQNNHTPFKSTAFTSYAFDVSVSEFFVPLLRGDELHILSDRLRKDVLLTSKYINDYQINYVYIPPVLLTNLPRIKYPSLKAIIYAGEACDAETAHYWSDKVKLYNYYGPTETSIYATGLQLMKNEVHLIGKPISNTTAYILNNHKMLQPIGVVGELYIGGQGIAKGYLNQKELTQERFISNPFQTREERLENNNNRLYKTGDLARWHPDGNIEYLGRNDFQTKIRGYRIELGEIETALVSYPGIKQAIVLVHDQIDSEDPKIAHKFLVGYYVSDNIIEELRIQEYLSLHLPEYMHPRALIYLSHLPITPNGKIDRNALPKIELTHKNYIPPTNDKETLICDAFAKVLALEKVGIEDDFFKCGGNSIIAISLVALLQNNFNINVADVFNLKTPKKLAKDILFIKNNLLKNLGLIRARYETKNLKVFDEAPFQDKLDKYYNSIEKIGMLESLPISNVLLTGATGFLGCNLLNTLLTTTNYSVFLLIRASSDIAAFERINAKYNYYFGQHLFALHNKRLFVYAGELEQNNLGINRETYMLLINQIDSIIHSAALTKHYGDYDTFFSANVRATQNLLELAKLTKLKSFHYISTTSILNEGYIPNCDYYIFSEDDDGNSLEGRSNTYVKTKYEGERLTLKYRKQGVNSTIYRVGNLAFIAKNHLVQENIEDNAFYTRLKCFIDLNMIAKEIGTEEISPVDLTAQAILKLMPIKQLSNQSFHVFNPKLTDLGEILSKSKYYKTPLVTLNYFISNIIDRLTNEEYNQTIELFLLHKRWLNEENLYNTHIDILQNKTQFILKKLGFEWPTITSDDITKILKGR